MVILDTLAVTKTNSKAMLHAATTNAASGNHTNVAGQYINPDDILNPLTSAEVTGFLKKIWLIFGYFRLFFG